MTLPYDMGNAGDLLKHGVLAEFARWQCGLGGPFRFLDPFGGEPWGRAVPDVARRVRALSACALREAQTGIEEGRYCGSGLVVRHLAEAARRSDVQVLSGDACLERRERLRAAGLSMLYDEFATFGAGVGRDGHDGYAALTEIARGAREGDLVLVDPFLDDFVEERAPAVVPRMAEMVERAAVLLFALHPHPEDPASRRFDALLAAHLPGAWRVTCPPLVGTRIRGESTYHAEVVLAARPLLKENGARDAGVLWERVTELTERLAGVFHLPLHQVRLRIVGR